MNENMESLRGVQSISGQKVRELEEFAPKCPKEPVIVNHKNNGITFRMGMKNKGCDERALLETALIIMIGQNSREGHPERTKAIIHLHRVLASLDKIYANKTA